MSSPIKTYRKSTIERRRLYLDYSCWLEETRGAEPASRSR